MKTSAAQDKQDVMEDLAVRCMDKISSHCVEADEKLAPLLQQVQEIHDEFKQKRQNIIQDYMGILNQEAAERLITSAGLSKILPATIADFCNRITEEEDGEHSQRAQQPANAAPEVGLPSLSCNFCVTNIREEFCCCPCQEPCHQ